MCNELALARFHLLQALASQSLQRVQLRLPQHFGRDIQRLQ
jgi:hypothetical protein